MGAFNTKGRSGFESPSQWQTKSYVTSVQNYELLVFYKFEYGNTQSMELENLRQIKSNHLKFSLDLFHAM